MLRIVQLKNACKYLRENWGEGWGGGGGGGEGSRVRQSAPFFVQEKMQQTRFISESFFPSYLFTEFLAALPASEAITD